MTNAYFGIDIGNSGLRIAALDVHQHSLSEALRITWDRGNAAPAGSFQPHSQNWLVPLKQYLSLQPRPTHGWRWLVSSVRRDALQVLTDFVRQERREPLHVLGAADIPLQVNVQNPQRLGIDRLLAAWAATSISDRRPLIVIQAGSAVTVDLVSGQPRDAFEGGAIVPGVPMILRLLATAADMLPEVVADELTDLPDLPGRNTEAAMMAGAASALVGGVQHLVSRYRSAYGQDAPVILSGGDGLRLSPYIPQPLVVQSQLVLQGLLMFAQLQAALPSKD